MKRFNKESYLYDWISCVIPDRVYFGPIPNQFMIQQLFKHKFNLIVNLTEEDYQVNCKMIHYPIVDKSIPSNVLDYCKFILTLKKEYENSMNKIYIHCLAGHSRSSMITVSLLSCIYDGELKNMIDRVIISHRNRVHLRNIWQVRSPFNYKQFSFLCTIHKNIYINLHKNSKLYNWLSPKNINIESSTLDQCGYPKEKLIDIIYHNYYFMSKLKHTYFKKMIFISDEKEKNEFYTHLFKEIREISLNF